MGCTEHDRGEPGRVRIHAPRIAGGEPIARQTMRLHAITAFIACRELKHEESQHFVALRGIDRDPKRSRSVNRQVDLFV